VERVFFGLLMSAVVVASADLCSNLPPPGTRPWNGLAVVPPMGWNSWYGFYGNVSESKIREQADLLVSLGLKNLGYTYVNLDDLWQGSRDGGGNITPSPVKFPSGMKSLADYVHSKGLKFGIYTSPNSTTCGGAIGSLGHEAQDALTYASWGADFLKYDYCGVDATYTAAGCFTPSTRQQVGQLMAESLQATGRPIVYSISYFGVEATWAADAGANMWRVGQDCCGGGNVWNAIAYYSFPRLTGSRVGHWADPDMITIGLGQLKDAEYRTVFNMYSIFAAPLILSNDLTTLSGRNLATVSNAEVIAVDQDPLGSQGTTVSSVTCGSATCQVIAKKLIGNRWAVVLVNLDTAPQSVTATWKTFTPGPLLVRDLWSHSDLGSFATGYSTTLAGHESTMILTYEEHTRAGRGVRRGGR